MFSGQDYRIESNCGNHGRKVMSNEQITFSYCTVVNIIRINVQNKMLTVVSCKIHVATIIR